MKLGFSRQIFEKYSNIKLHEYPSSGAELFHEDVRTDGQTDVTNLIVALRNFANVPKECKLMLYFKWQAVYRLSTPRARTVLCTQAQQITTSSNFSNVFYLTLNVHYRIHNSTSQNYTLKPMNMLFIYDRF